MDWSEIADRAARSFLQGAATAFALAVVPSATGALEVHVSGPVLAVAVVLGGCFAVASAVMNGGIKLAKDSAARLRGGPEAP